MNEIEHLKCWITPELIELNVNCTEDEPCTGKVLPGNDAALDINNNPCGS
jgi:hypothetical protein